MNGPPWFVTERHALYAGWVLGVAMRNGLNMRPGDDGHGNFTDELIFTADDGTEVRLVVPPPPDDWEFPDDASTDPLRSLH